MDTPIDWQRLNTIFQGRQDILDGIKRCAETPGKVALFNEIAVHIFNKFQIDAEPDAKRRKLQNDTATNGSSLNSNAGAETVLLAVKEISVSIPQRKKFELCLTENHLYARAPGTDAPIPAITYSWSDIEFAFYLPVPEKAQVQHNYILFPRGTSLPSKTNPPSIEPLVFTIPATAPKEGTISGSEAGAAAAVSDTYKTLFHWALNRRLAGANNPVQIVSANPNKFQSVIRQSHRPQEKSVHVGGFRGSKDGYLFFLENGILWGFKKPLLFVPLNRIVAVSYTSILQITFNMVVEVFTSEGETTEELEFAMLDQQDYAGIENYVRQNGLQDQSMAEQRKAKLQLAENRVGKKGGDGTTNEDAPGTDMTELERAQQDAEQQMADDDDDEEEEDFDPGTEGDSDGSGESDEESDDGEGNNDDEEDEGSDVDDEDEVEEEEDEEGEEDNPQPANGPRLSMR